MNTTILNIENKRSNLLEILENSNSKRANLLHINDFFTLLLSLRNKQLTVSYILEFADTYFRLISGFDPFCIDPTLTEIIIDQANEILTFIEENEKHKYSESIKIIENKLGKLKEYLAGKSDYSSSWEIWFPLIEDNQNQLNQIKLNLLESVSIQIKKSNDKNSFNLIPSERELEQRIKCQVESSWSIAVAYIKRYIGKVPQYHDVVISFQSKSGIVEGNSLGAALTLAFIKELLKHYNAAIHLSTSPGTAYTGGINETGSIISVSENIIKMKTEAVFYSGIKTFAVPKEDESAAQLKLKELIEKYPERKLKITGVDDFEDLISRRNLIEIKKINPVIRGTKFAVKHSLSIVLMLLLSAVIFISGLIDFDNNPAVLKYENQHLRVYNANDKLLWSEKVGNISDTMLDGSIIKRNFALINDINGDGINEVILSNIVFGPRQDDPEYNGVLCYDNKKQLIWQHTFKEVVSTKDITFTTEFRTSIICVVSENGRNILFVSARHHYFPSAIFGIDLLTGKKASGVFWHAGHIVDGFVFDDEDTKKRKLLIGGVNNGFEAVAVMIVELDKLEGQAPAPENYRLKEISDTEIDEYILIPQTDYSEYSNNRYNAVAGGYVKYQPENNLFLIATSEVNKTEIVEPNLHYYFNQDLSVNFIEMGDSFQHDRDILVKEGKLSPPLTYTAEYFEILKNNIKYWNGEKFVDHLQYFKSNKK